MVWACKAGFSRKFRAGQPLKAEPPGVVLETRARGIISLSHRQHTLIPLFRGGLSIPISRPPPPSALGKKHSRVSRKASRTLAARFRLRKVRVLRPVNTERAETRQHSSGRRTSERAQRPNGLGARRTRAAPRAWRPSGPDARSTRAAPGAWRPSGPVRPSRTGARLGEGRAPAHPGFACPAPAIGCPPPPAFIPYAHVLPNLCGFPCARDFPCTRGLPFARNLPFELIMNS